MALPRKRQEGARPKVGDLVEFKFGRSVKVGKIIAVAETGVHYLIKLPSGYKYPSKMVGLTDVIRILPPEVDDLAQTRLTESTVRT